MSDGGRRWGSAYSMGVMKKAALLAILLVSYVYGADKLSAPQLIQLAKSRSPRLEEAIRSSFEAKDLQAGTAWAGQGADFFFATEAASRPELAIDDAIGPRM